MANASGEKAYANDPVANNHDCGKDGVARQPNSLRPTGNHHGDDKRHLNNGDSEGQDECPEWLPDTMRDDFGMVDRRKNSGD
jgi:hypothetical protein